MTLVVCHHPPWRLTPRVFSGFAYFHNTLLLSHLSTLRLRRGVIPDLQNKNFSVKIKNRVSPDIKLHPMSNKIDQSIFSEKSILVSKAHDSPFPTGPLHWSLNAKDKTKVTIGYEPFDLLDLKGVNINMTNKAGEATIIGGGTASYNPAMTKIHWSIPAINQSNRKGTIQFLVAGAVEASKFFPIGVTFSSTSTYCNLQLSVVPVKKHK